MNAGVLHLNNPCTGKQGQEEEEFKVIFGHKALEKKNKPNQNGTMSSKEAHQGSMSWPRISNRRGSVSLRA